MPSCSKPVLAPLPWGVAGRLDEPWLHGLRTRAQGLVSPFPAVQPWPSPSTLPGLRLITGKMEQIISTPLTSAGIQGEDGNEMALQGKGGEDVKSSRVRMGCVRG